MNWNDTLDVLTDPDHPYADDGEIVEEAMFDAKEWGTCSVAELILDYDDRWADLTEGARCGIVEEFPELSELGREFMVAIEEEEYDKARDLHTQIQKYSIDEPALNKLITVFLA